MFDVNYDGLKEYCRQLSAIGNNVNQIVRRCQKTGNTYEEDIKEIKDLKEIRYYLQQYKDNAPFKQQYNNSRDKEKYYMNHEEQLPLFDGAKNKLREYGIKPNISELKQVSLDIENLERKESELEMKYDYVKKEAADLKQKYKNITEYLGLDKSGVIAEQIRKVHSR